MPVAIPVLDLSEGRPAVRRANEIGAGFRDFGFLGIRGHGVGKRVIAEAFRTARELFALPLERKLRYEVPGGAGQRGYTRLGVEKAKDRRQPDLKEFWHVGREVPHDHPLAQALQPNPWPEEVPGFREAQLALFAELERVGREVLADLAVHLSLRDDWFASRTDHGNSILRAIHYPPLEPPTLATSSRDASSGALRSAELVEEPVRAAAHEDINLITLLVGSHEPGLEILTRAGEWIPVTTLPGTIVVNAGDMLQRLTNDLLPSTTHRVVNPPPPWSARSRYSIPFFLHFNPDVPIETLPSCITPTRPNRYPTPITADAFLKQRLREIGLLY